MWKQHGPISTSHIEGRFVKSQPSIGLQSSALMPLLVAPSTSIERRCCPDYEQQICHCLLFRPGFPSIDSPCLALFLANLRRQTSSALGLTYGGIRSRCQREDTYQ
ncbi:hypothetical protein MUK42_33731 [Musa troglodytarum]|uniref:Uncharacterized protein n=1 Tax=Musa troglodytarum TaxID=320322 RepID=A0A9E7JTR0_9LILI|nr:hypothetical protein MUK42_33731 [Musa troglodytarum]